MEPSFSEGVWAELAQADLAALQQLNARWIVERAAGHVNETVDLLIKTLDGLRQTEATPLAFVQVGEFMESIGEPPPMFADDILPDRQLILWTGKAKAGKSLACYQIMEDVALGNPIFGQFQLNKPGVVLYIGMEDGQHEINRRLRQRGFDPADKSCPIYINTEWRDFGQQVNVDALRAYAAQMPDPPVLVVIDTFTESFDCVRDWNDRNQTKRAMRPLRNFAQEFCTVIGILHNVKGNAEERDSGDEIAGSLGVLSSVDGYLSCYKRRLLGNGNLQLFVRGGGRGGILPADFLIEMDTESYHWRWVDEQEQQQAAAQEAKARKIKHYDKIQRALLAKNGEATVGEVAQHTGLGDRYVRSLIKEMLDAGRIAKTGKTKSDGGAGKPAPLYGLPSSPNNNNGTASSLIGLRYNSDAESGEDIDDDSEDV